MIIPNGYIEMKRKGGGGIDPETGYPVEGESEWGARALPVLGEQPQLAGARGRRALHVGAVHGTGLTSG